MKDSLPQNAGFQNDPYLRIKKEKVDQLLDLIGELGLAVAVILHHPALAGVELEGFQNDAHRLETLVRDAQDQISELRLVPVGQLFRRMQRTVHDLLEQTGKKAVLALAGDDTELDKMLVDQLSEPLMHLLRNAIDHGLESPAERIAAGKPAQGKITLSAAQQGREILISVEDDGAGLNRAAILKKARATGLVGEKEEPEDRAIWAMIFRAGFSTASQVSSLSGRGVGMDVVRSAVENLRGQVQIETRPGRGTCITLAIPLTLAFLDALVVSARGRLYAIPIEAINEVFKPASEQVLRASASGSEVVDWQGQIVPVGRLEQIYAEGGADGSLLDQIIIVVHTRGGLFGLPVDEILGQQQVILKPLRGFLSQIHGGAGCALLGTGEVAVVLDVDQLFCSRQAQ